MDKTDRNEFDDQLLHAVRTDDLDAAKAALERWKGANNEK